jgi:NADH dehydrogenase
MSTRRPRKIFLTGATGFIGSVLMNELAPFEFDLVTCLTRRPELMRSRYATAKNVRWVFGDLNRPESYRDALAGNDIVVHMAAATGSATKLELRRINVEGTQLLLDACRSVGVRDVLYMSSIAARYADLASYPYGRTKFEAERRVEESGLEHVILRPTIVLGEQGSTWKMLRKLASLPVVPVFRQGATRVQPIDVVDVARAMTAIIKGRHSVDRLIELGGPDVVTFADFLLRIRKAIGQGPIRTVSIPVWPVHALLKATDGLLGGRFPVSAGQLSPFLHDGTASPNALHVLLKPSMATLDSLLGRIANAG